MTGRRRIIRKLPYHDYEVIDLDAKVNKSSIGEKIAKRITSKFNQHITIIMVGGTGTGKSWAAMDLAYQAAREVAFIDKGKDVMPDSWQEYFNLDHMAIITLDRVTELLKNIKPHGIYILDDIGVGYNNRDWMKDKNKKMNQIIQTFRTDNTCVIYTVPSKGLIDKVPRELVEWYMEFERSEQIFSMGLNTCKFLDITTLKRANKQLFIYDTVQSTEGRQQFVRHIAERPPDVLTVPYEAMRVTIAKELREMNAEDIQATKPSDDRTQIRDQDRIAKFNRVAEITELVGEGMTHSAACSEIGGMTPDQYRKFKNGERAWYNQLAAAAGIPEADG